MPDRPLDAALYVAREGWRVFPVKAGSKEPLLMGDWQRHATNDERTILAWRYRHPQANYGVEMGASGLLGIDIDEKNGISGMRTWMRWCASVGIDYKYDPIVLSPNGGLHIIFKHPGGPIGNAVPAELRPGIDIRGAGGYLVGAGSQVLVEDEQGNPELAEYVPFTRQPTENWTRLVQLPPQPLIDLLLPARHLHVVRSAPPRSDISRVGALRLRDELPRLENVAEGSRNTLLNDVSFRIGRLVPSGAYSHEYAADLILTHALNHMGLPESECRKTIESGLRGGERQPQYMHGLPSQGDGGMSL